MKRPAGQLWGEQRAFTLIELMVVIVIAGILATLAVPKVLAASTRAKVSEACAVLASYEKAELSYIHESGDVGVAAELAIEDPCVAGFSKYFDYSETVTPSIRASLFAAGKAGQGAIASQEIWTDVGVDMSIVHDHDAVYERYAPSWK